MSDLSHVAGLVYGAPWAILPEKLEAMRRVLDERLAGDRLTEAEILARLGGELPARRNYEVRNGVAVLPVFGVIDKRASFFTRASGGTSTDALVRDLAAALADPEVKAIALDVNSPGGSVPGVEEASTALYQARGVKPTVAMVNEQMTSAAYWIGSACGEVVITKTGGAGSIGVIAVHQEESKAQERYGVKTTVLTAGKYKGAGNPHEPLSDDARAVIQARLDTFYALFVDAVARNRGASVEAVLERMADGRVFIGAQAIEAGLADRLGTFDGVLAELAGRGKVSVFLGGGPMDLNELKAKHPALVEQVAAETLTRERPAIERAAVDAAKPALEQAAVAAARPGIEQEAVGRERKRVGDFAAAFPDDPKFAFTAIAGGKTLEQAKAERHDLVAKELAETRQKLASATQTAPFVATDGNATQTTAAGAGVPTDDQLKAEWNANAQTRDEFGSFETFKAYKQADARGQVRRLSKSDGK